MAFCMNCGKEITNTNARFCPHCGTAISATSDSQENTSQSQDNISNSSQAKSILDIANFMDMFFESTGRLNRLRFLKRLLFLLLTLPFLAVLVFWALEAFKLDNFFIDVINNVSELKYTEKKRVLLNIIFFFLIVPPKFPFWCITIRRLNDLGNVENFNKIYAFLANFSLFLAWGFRDKIFGFICFVMYWYLICKPGTVGVNPYGDNPLGNSENNFSPDEGKSRIIFLAGVLLLGISLFIISLNH